LDAANSAPSAGNLQSYKVYVVRNDEAKDEIMMASSDQECIVQAPLVLIFCAVRNPNLKYGERGADLYSVQDATIAAAYAQLAATEEGLGTVWVGAFDSLEVARIINADSYEVPVALIPLGYPADNPRPRERKPIAELMKEV
jgi:nitroreductase